MTNIDNNQLLQIIDAYEDSSLSWRERRHDPWTENYTLYRDTVLTNRLTQRQSVNIPLMKYTIQTLMKDIDDAPILYFSSKDNDEQAEIFYNEYWKYIAREEKLVIKDHIDKKQVMLYGRSFKKLNIVNGHFTFEIVDPQDILIDRYVDPASIDTARYFSHIHIYRPLSSLSQNEAYDQQAVTELKEFYATEQGLVKATENAQAVQDRNQRMEQMGVPDVDSPVLGETYVELKEHYVKLFDDKLDKDVYYLIVIADDTKILQRKPLAEVIGKTEGDYWQSHLPFSSWGSDPERTDFWSDGPGDVARMPNKIVNSWFSQLVENRTLRNFGMRYYDSSLESFTPQTFEPVAWGWYPIPVPQNGDINKVVKDVSIPDLSDSLDEMNFILTMTEKATAANATSQGSVTPEKVTLGEVQLALASAKERVKSLTPLYNDSWEEFGVKYTKMLEAASDMLDEVTITKKGRLGKRNYTRVIKPDDWGTINGYNVEVKEVKDKAAEDLQAIQKLTAVRQNFADNAPFDEIFKRKLLEFGDLNATEIKEVLDFEKQKKLAPPPVETVTEENPANKPMMDNNKMPMGASPMMGA